MAHEGRKKGRATNILIKLWAREGAFEVFFGDEAGDRGGPSGSPSGVFYNDGDSDLGVIPRGKSHKDGVVFAVRVLSGACFAAEV